MNTEKMVSPFYIGAATGRNHNLVILTVILVVALYINLAKVVLGSRYYTLLADIALAALSLRLIAYRLLAGRSFARAEIAVALFVLMGLVQIFNPNVPSVVVGLEGFRRLMFQMLAVSVGVAAVRDRNDLFQVCKWVAIFSLPILLYGIKQFFYISDFDYAIIMSNTASIDTWRIFGKIRAFGIFNGPFHLGLFSGIVFWITVAMNMATKKRIYLVVAIAAFGACLASLTRSSIVALCVSFPLVLFYAFDRHRLRVFLITLIVIIVTSVSIFVARSNFEEIDKIFSSVSSLENAMEGTRLTSRFEDYRRGFELLKSHPFGIGMGSAADAMETNFQPNKNIHVTSHNMFLRIALETGWLGLLLFLGFIVYLFAAVRRLKRSGDTIATVMLAGPLVIIMIAGLTGSTIGAYPVNLLLWSLCGILVALSHIQIRASHDE